MFATTSIALQVSLMQQYYEIHAIDDFNNAMKEINTEKLKYI